MAASSRAELTLQERREGGREREREGGEREGGREEGRGREGGRGERGREGGREREREGGETEGGREEGNGEGEKGREEIATHTHTHTHKEVHTCCVHVCTCKNLQDCENTTLYCCTTHTSANEIANTFPSIHTHYAYMLVWPETHNFIHHATHQLLYGIMFTGNEIT